MKVRKNDRIVKEGDPLFEKLKSQMRPDLRKGLKQIVLIGGNKRCGAQPKARLRRVTASTDGKDRSCED